MAKPQTIEEKPLTMAEVKEELERIKKRDTELNYRGKKTEEYLNFFVTMKAKEAKELYKKIEGLQIPRLREIHITKIVDILPAKPEMVKVIFQGQPITISEESAKKIANAVKEYTEKK